jgi:hypothetical protein
MALLNKIDKIDDYIEEKQVVKNSVEDEMSLKDSSSFKGDMENNEFKYNLLLDVADELHMNYFDFCDEDLMAIYSGTIYGLIHDYTEVSRACGKTIFGR